MITGVTRDGEIVRDIHRNPKNTLWPIAGTLTKCNCYSTWDREGEGLDHQTKLLDLVTLYEEEDGEIDRLLECLHS